MSQPNRLLPTAPIGSVLSLVTAVIVLAGGLSGCSSPRRGKFEPPPPQPFISAEATYLDGAIVVEADLGPFHRPRPAHTTGRSDDAANDEPAAADYGERHARGMRGEGGGGMGGSGMRGDGGPRSGGMRGEGGDAGAGPRPNLRAAMGGPSRQVLTVTLRNLSDHAIHLRVADISSALGDYVPVPETFTLEPGASQVLEPMRGNYPAAINRLALTVRLRTAEANDEHVLQLLPAPGAPASSPPPPASP